MLSGPVLDSALQFFLLSRAPATEQLALEFLVPYVVLALAVSHSAAAASGGERQFPAFAFLLLLRLGRTRAVGDVHEDLLALTALFSCVALVLSGTHRCGFVLDSFSPRGDKPAVRRALLTIARRRSLVAHHSDAWTATRR